MFLGQIRSRSRVGTKTRFPVEFWSLIRFINSKYQSYRSEILMQYHLNRLAETSPHLLDDIGVSETGNAEERETPTPPLVSRGQL